MSCIIEEDEYTYRMRMNKTQAGLIVIELVSGYNVNSRIVYAPDTRN